MKEQRAKNLLKKYQEGKCTHDEIALVESWYINEAKTNVDVDEPDYDLTSKEIWIKLEESNHKKPFSIRWYKSGIAAAALIILTFAGYLFIAKRVERQQVVKNIPKYDILPGGNKAVLTLGDGSKISLQDGESGIVANQAGLTIMKKDDGELVYTATGKTGQEPAEPVYNTITTPRGGKYEINLPDGSKVWLNAASSLRFPITFAGKERKVELSGEAYFEVAHNKSKPFIVNTQKQEVKVFGTHFNINAYEDEPAIKTTLLEGSVMVTQTGTANSQMLTPGEQAQVNETIKVTDANIEEVIAWKNGMFTFTDTDIKSVMRVIARWYDIEVVFDGKIKDTSFGGSVSRSLNISEILKVLELTDAVHFKIEERRIIVMP